MYSFLVLYHTVADRMYQECQRWCPRLAAFPKIMQLADLKQIYTKCQDIMIKNEPRVYIARAIQHLKNEQIKWHCSLWYNWLKCFQFDKVCDICVVHELAVWTFCCVQIIPVVVNPHSLSFGALLRILITEVWSFMVYNIDEWHLV